MDPSTSTEPLEFSDLEGESLTKRPGELNGCAELRRDCLISAHAAHQAQSLYGESFEEPLDSLQGGCCAQKSQELQASPLLTLSPSMGISCSFAQPLDAKELLRCMRVSLINSITEWSSCLQCVPAGSHQRGGGDGMHSLPDLHWWASHNQVTAGVCAASRFAAYLV